MTLQVTTLPAHSNMPGKAGPRSQARKHRIASAYHLRPRAAPSAAWPGATSCRYFMWRQGTGEVQPLPTTFSSASSSQGDVFRGASGSQGGACTWLWAAVQGDPTRAGDCLRAQGAPPHSRVPSPMGEVLHGHSAGIQTTGVTEALT